MYDVLSSQAGFSSFGFLLRQDLFKKETAAVTSSPAIKCVFQGEKTSFSPSITVCALLSQHIIVFISSLEYCKKIVKFLPFTGRDMKRAAP